MIINGEQLTMIRGDTESLDICLFDAHGEPETFKERDLIEFTIRENINRKEPSLHKVIRVEEETHCVQLIIHSFETEGLKPKDDYVYDIQLTQGRDHVTTIVGPDYFSLIGDVTRG